MIRRNFIDSVSFTAAVMQCITSFCQSTRRVLLAAGKASGLQATASAILKLHPHMSLDTACTEVAVSELTAISTALCPCATLCLLLTDVT